MRDNLNMQAWPDRRLLDLLKIETPIIQAPMAGSDSVALARAVSSTGALGSLACALLSPEDVREAMPALRRDMARPLEMPPSHPFKKIPITVIPSTASKLFRRDSQWVCGRGDLLFVVQRKSRSPAPQNQLLEEEDEQAAERGMTVS